MVALALLVACDSAPTDGTLSVGLVEVRERLGVGEFIDWDRFAAGSSSIRPGVDTRFEDVVTRRASGVEFAADGEAQTISLAVAAGADGNGDVALVARAYRAAPGDHYKGWLLATVTGSNNPGGGFCGDAGGFDKEPFRSQLQMQFVRAGGGVIDICYCNICPVSEGALVSCATDQWHPGGSQVSDGGACRAPAGTESVEVQIEAVGKEPGDRGTAVFQRFRFGRCRDDGTCGDIEPDWY